MSGHTPIEIGEYCLYRPIQSYMIGRVVREGKRFAWVKAPNGEVYRETRSQTMWRFKTKEEAQAELDELDRIRLEACRERRAAKADETGEAS